MQVENDSSRDERASLPSSGGIAKVAASQGCVLKLTALEWKALKNFMDTGLSIEPIVRKGDPDHAPLLRVDTKLRNVAPAADEGRDDLLEALKAIDALEVMEINPSNYSHEDVCELNNNAVQASLIARAALSKAESR